MELLIHDTHIGDYRNMPSLYALYMTKLAAVSYHGSTKRFDTLRAGSWVTPFKADARSFAVPWDSKQLAPYRSINHRPPKRLKFKSDTALPKDSPIYIYKIKGEVVPAKTNTGKEYSWNRQITQDTPAVLIETHPSWRKHFGVAPQ